MGKTESILFGTKQKLNKQGHVNLNITCAGNIIQSKSQVKYLGVELDQFLSGDCITTKIVGKSIKFLYRQAKHFDMGTRKTLVSTLIQCHMDYTCSAWYTGLSKRNKSRLQTAQNKLIRFILQLSARSHVGYSEFKMAGMLPVEKRVTQLQLNHIFNIVHGNAPNYLKSNFIFNEHSFNTRSGTLSFIVPNVTTNIIMENQLFSTGIKACD